MIRRCFCWLSLIVIGVAGCLSDEPRFDRRNAKVPTPLKLPEASLSAATRVDSLGRRILAANKDIGVQPVFTTFGVPDVTLFHEGATRICISEGLVEKCKTDEELAALLCAELGKMVSEAQVRGPARTDREPPYAPVVGSDIVGGGGDPDRTRLAERAMFEKQNQRTRGGSFVAGGDPGELARQYLNKSGFNPDELLKVLPLLRMAEANPKYEGLINGNASGLSIPNAP